LSDKDRSIWEKVSKTLDKHLTVTEDRKSLKANYVGVSKNVSPSYMVEGLEKNLNYNKYKHDSLSKGIRNQTQ
jgi:hypothetical protein